MEKRGVSMFPFVVIFVMIAGAIILFFFFGFSKDILKQGTTVNDLEIVNVIDRELDSLNLASNSIKKIQVSSKPEIDISCSSKKTSIELNDVERDTVKLITSPGKLKGENIEIWTLAWNYPFKIDNFYYLANKRIKFYFQRSGQTDFEKSFYNGLNGRFSKTTINAANIPTTDLGTADKHVFVFYSTPHPPAISLANDKRVNMIYVDETNGEVTFYNQTGSSRPYEFIGFPMLYAALFAENSEEYGCVKEMALERLGIVADVYKGKANLLRSQTSTECVPKYSAVSTTLEDFKDNPKSKFDSIESINRQLVSEGCPPLYKRL